MSTKGEGYLDASVLGCQLSVYPLRQINVDAPVQAAIRAVGEHCSVRVGNLSTLFWGDEDDVFAGLRAAFRAAQMSGPVVLSATIASGMPGDELVVRIQTDVEKATGERE